MTGRHGQEGVADGRNRKLKAHIFDYKQAEKGKKRMTVTLNPQPPRPYLLSSKLPVVQPRRFLQQESKQLKITPGSP